MNHRPLHPSPCLRTYVCAIQKLSESMNVEMAPKGIHVQCQVPLMVATKLAKVSHSTALPTTVNDDLGRRYNCSVCFSKK